VLSSLGGRIPLIIDGGPAEHGIESTILGFNGARLTLLRPGPLDFAELAAASQLPQGAPPDGIEAPGQLASHYAPTKALRLNAAQPEPGEWMIGFGPSGGDDNLSPAGSLVEAASRLFGSLHRADSQARPRIAVAPIPEEGIGIAINDRLRRAAAPHHQG
jgi:L-threonylcarbamoyladenylate synthase